MDKNILIIGLNSELAQDTIAELKQKKWNIYATSRQVGMMDEKVREYNLDVTNEIDFIHLKEKFADIKFDVILNFAGIAIAGAVDELSEIEVKKQFDVNFYGLLRIIKYFAPNLNKNGRLINISSMASYGIFPFLSPYCASKAAADILLNSFANEANVKVVSIRPGAIATKFWETSIEINKGVFESMSRKYRQEKKFLVDNANKNSLHATSPIYVAKKIANIVELNNPKPIYNIGLDAKFTKLTRFIPQGWINTLVKLVLKYRANRN